MLAGANSMDEQSSWLSQAMEVGQKLQDDFGATLSKDQRALLEVSLHSFTLPFFPSILFEQRFMNVKLTLVWLGLANKDNIFTAGLP